MKAFNKRVLSEPKPYCNKCVRRVCPTEGILEMPSVMPFLGLARSSYSARQGAPARSETRLRVVTSWSSSSQKAPSERQLRPRLGPEVVLHSKGRDGFRCVVGLWEPSGSAGAFRAEICRGSKHLALPSTSLMRLSIPVASPKVREQATRNDTHARAQAWLIGNRNQPTLCRCESAPCTYFDAKVMACFC